MEDCLFCKIAQGEIGADILFSDDQALAFRDINPKAPVHILVIPKKHIASALDLARDDSTLLSHLFEVIREVAESEGIATSGMRIVSNVGKDADQVVPHLHFHVLGGRRMLWPPG